MQIYRFITWPYSFVFALILASSGALAADPLADAIKAIDSGRPALAVQLLTPLANTGNTLAMYRLGMLHYMGQGVPEDEKQAIYYWKKAAAQGSIDAMYQLGSAYLFGTQAAKTVPDPDREAAIWYFQAASAGHADAQYHLGLLFLAGKGVVDSRPESARWMRKAASQGHPEAKKALQMIESGK
ncbi:tetratricopeptide repeat protein [Dechloromonas sp. A34]|uniref:tetratricopeptide repeat protein n=1 Tax=Dechloromonas sp. A34 TaxID=447588 RepID=UPI002249183F|nr:tetratricopeptide repeat protein [Dechloromonas sp. A34]